MDVADLKVTRDTNKKEWGIFRFVVGVVAVIIVVLVIKAIIDSPRDLGSDMIYVGRDDVGSWWFFTDTLPYSTYYFATNMTVDQVKNYVVSKTHYTYDTASLGDRTASTAYLSFEKGNQSIDIVYYANLDVAKHYNTTLTLKSIPKEHLIEMRDSEYPLLR